MRMNDYSDRDYEDPESDLDEGATCCLCCGLECRYHCCGCLSFIGIIFIFFDGLQIVLYITLKKNVPIKLIYEIIFFLIGTFPGFFWLKSCCARRKGNGRVFKENVQAFY